jgi:hypothetical protein
MFSHRPQKGGRNGRGELITSQGSVLESQASNVSTCHIAAMVEGACLHIAAKQNGGRVSGKLKTWGSKSLS